MVAFNGVFGKKRYFFLSILFFFLCFGIGMFFLGKNEESVLNRKGLSKQEVFLIPLSEVDIPLTKTETEEGDIDPDKLRGGIVPHHLLADALLTEFFSLLQHKKTHPETILLFSPNHYEKGEGNIQTVKFTWKTPFGEIYTDDDLLEAVKHGGATISSETFAEEHGIYNVLPYISYFFPKTKVVPVVFKYNVSSQEIEQLLDAIYPQLKKGKIFVVSSVDFSHYLSKQEAEKNDKETKQAIQDFNMSEIARYGSEHLDSPGSVNMLLRVGQTLGATKVIELGHDNSADVLRERNISTTSHFTFFLSDN